MDSLVQYAIPVKSKKDGVYHFDFQVDPAFFAQFEDSPIDGGHLQVGLDLEKRADLYVLDFHIEGTIQTECDRCLAPINLPIETDDRLMVKVTEVERESDDPDIDYLSAEAHQLNVAGYIYEFIVLATPMIKVYDCESEPEPPCNDALLERLEGDAQTDSEGESGDNPIWADLKKLNIKRD